MPSPQVESLLCALLGLVLNRKKPVEYVHRRHRWNRGTAHVEDAISMLGPLADTVKDADITDALSRRLSWHRRASGHPLGTDRIL